MTDKIIRIQEGHYGRTSGSTGAYNASMNLAEADMNHELAHEVLRIAEGIPGVAFELIGPDERPYRACDMFIALHMDGNDNPEAQRPSIGYPPASKASKLFGAILKVERDAIPGALKPFRDDNYTRGLAYYYGYKSSYSATAPVKIVFENGFVTNPHEAQWAINKRSEVATAIVESVLAYYGLPDIKESRRVQNVSLEVETGGAVSEVKLMDGWQEVAKAVPDVYSPWVELWQRMLRHDGDVFPSEMNGLVGPSTLTSHKAWESREGSGKKDGLPGQFEWRKLVNRMTAPNDVVEVEVEAPANHSDVQRRIDEAVERATAELRASNRTTVRSMQNRIDAKAEELESCKTSLANVTAELDAVSLRVSRARDILGS